MTFLVAAGGLLAPAAASAIESTPAPPPAPVAAPVTITTDANQFFSGIVTLSGTKDPSHVVQIPSLTGGDPYCEFAEGPTDWSCSFAGPTNGESTFEAIAFAGSTAISQASVTVRSLLAPTIDGPDTTARAIFGGGAMPGATIVISGDDFTHTCEGPAGGAGGWNCVLPDVTEGAQTLTATQLWPDSGESGPTSADRTITVDRTPPPRPTISSPTPGQQIAAGDLTVSGVAAESARVEVFLDGTLACSAEPGAGGAFSCVAPGLSEGAHEVWALSWDAAGNSTAVQSAVAVTIPPPADPPSTGGQPVPAPAPATDEPEAAPAPAPEPPSPAPAPSAAPLPDPQGLPFFPPPVGGKSNLPPGETWGTSTHYGDAIPDSRALGIGWFIALLLGVALVVLVALPLRLFANAIRDRFPRSAARAEDEPPLLSPLVALGGALVVTVVLAALAGGLQAEVRYLRLGVALAAALVGLNLLVVLLGTWAGSRMGVKTGIRIEPLFVVVAALAALASRFFGLQPPVILGIVLVILVTAAGSDRTRGIVSLAQLAPLPIVGALAWIAHGLLGRVEGFWISLLSETLAGLTLAGLGSAAILLIPVYRLPGRHIFEWSLPAWLAVALPTSVLAAAALTTTSTFPLGWVLGIAVAISAVSLATWAWVRFVEPAVATR